MLDKENPPSYLQNLLKKNSLYLIIILCLPFTVLSKPLLVKSDSSALIKSDKKTNRSFNIETYSEPSYKCNLNSSKECLSDEETDPEMPDLESISGYSSEAEIELEEGEIIDDCQQNTKNIHHMLTRSKAKSKINTTILYFENIAKH